MHALSLLPSHLSQLEAHLLQEVSLDIPTLSAFLSSVLSEHLESPANNLLIQCFTAKYP